jgi:hypothetical protein
MMEVKRFEFLLRAESPIAHAQESMGNHSIAMRRKVRVKDEWAHVPVITGDTMRHGLREAAAYAFLDAAGLLGQEAQLTEGALRLLFSGGMVTGRGDASIINLDRYREMTELCPPLSLLGGCCDSRVIPGRLVVEDALLVCEETRSMVPKWMLSESPSLESCRAHIEVVQRVRMDPTLDPSKRKLLAPASEVGAVQRLEQGESAHETDSAIERSEAKSSMLPRTHEAVVAGSLFAWSVTATTWTDLDADVLHTMVSTFLSDARVGGKRGTGHGKLRAIHARGVIVNRPSERTDTLDAAALAPKVGSLFRTHVSERRERIARFLHEANA